MRMTRLLLVAQGFSPVLLTLAIFVAVLAAAVPAEAQQYAARQKGDIVQLEDQKNQITVSIITSVGMIAYEMTVKGQNVLRGPNSIDEFRAKPAGLPGIPEPQYPRADPVRGGQSLADRHL